MRDLKSRIVHLEQAGPRGKPIIVVVGQDETREQAIARVKPHPDQLVIIVDQGCQHVKLRNKPLIRNTDKQTLL